MLSFYHVGKTSKASLSFLSLSGMGRVDNDNRRNATEPREALTRRVALNEIPGLGQGSQGEL